jgi:S1-C subfamily serine protease
MGVELADDAVADRLGLPGVMVLGVVPGSPAEKAGIVPTRRQPLTGEIVLGDVITDIDGAELRRAADLYLKLEKHQPGDSITISIVRDRQRRTLSLVLAKNVGD